MQAKAFFRCGQRTIIFALMAVAWPCQFARAETPDPATVEELTGEYYQGDGLGVNCTLKLKDKKFSFQWRGCLGVYDQNAGEVTMKEETLVLSPEKPNQRDGFRGTPTEFYPIRWGPRLYLIPDKEMIDFCSDINQGMEPRINSHGHWYLRQDDWKKNARGQPALPKPWAKYLLTQPIKGEITRLAGARQAWLNLGTKDGLMQGMTLTAKSRDNRSFAQVRVEMVEETRCRIKCLYNNDKLAAGQIVSSRFHDE